ncbi:unnamed protein product, partial [Rhizoctonia solani]
MWTRSGTSKSKSKGLQRWFRSTFSLSSSRLLPPESSSQPSVSQAPSSLGPSGALQAINNRADQHDVLPSTAQVPIASITHSMSAPAVIANPGPDSASADTPVLAAANQITNIAWVGLLASLKTLKDTSGVFGPLASAAGVLLECFGAIETAARNQQDYEDLATELAMLSDSLAQRFNDATPNTVSKCVSSVAFGVKKQTEEIKKKTTQGAKGRILVAKEEEEDLIRHYRRIQSLFRQLQANLSMSTWSIANELLVDARLKALNPEEKATYDSSLSSSISRRTCTEGTRTGVLANLVKWACERDTPAVYWMNGMAGTGKTTIACSFAEWLEQHELLAGSFFCTRTSVDCRDVTRIIPSVVYQLARYSASFQSTLCDMLSAKPDAGSKSISKQFECLLKDPLQQMTDGMLDSLVVVIDALDECDDQSGVETILDMLFQHAPHLPLKFFVTSRPEPGIYNKMLTHGESRAAIYLHDIEKSLVRADIELYLRENLAFMSPSSSDIERLVDRSGALFIYAATLVRYIHPTKQLADPHKRLRSVLSMTPEAIKEHAQIDGLYTAVLKSALSEEELDAEETEDIRAVLRTVLFAPEPISVETIAKLAGIDEPRRVEYALHPLRSVLHQSEETGLVSTLHASFPDFMFNDKRSGSYFCDVVEHSHLITQRCFSAMKEQLRFNICELESSFVRDDQVDDIQGRVKRKIPSTLAYVCRFWAHHLVLAPISHDLLANLEELLSHRLLFWMEVLNLRREMASGVEALSNTKKWLIQAGSTSLQLAMLVEDAHNFITGFASSEASQSTPHIYISSLPFCPRSSTVYKNYWNRTRGLLELKGSLMERREGAPLATWDIGSSVHSVAYSPDGTRVAAGCDDDTVKILNAHDGTLVVDPLEGHDGTVCSISFSPDGKFIASGSFDTTIRVWNAYNGTLIAGPFEGHTGAVICVAFSPDCTRLISGSHDTSLCIWDVNTGSLVADPRADSTNIVYAITVSPDGTFVACPSQNNAITLWNLPDMTCSTPPFEGHTNAIHCIAFTPDGSRLVSGSDDKTIRIWNTSDGSLATDPFKGHTDIVFLVAVSPDGTRVVSGSLDGTVRVWNIDDGILVAGPYSGHTSFARSVAFSLDGTRVISGSVDETIRVWNVHDRLLPPQTLFHDHLHNLKSASLLNNGTRILSSSEDRSTWVWDLRDGVIPNVLEGLCVPPVHSHLSSAAIYFAASAKDNSIEILDTNNASLAVGPLHGHTGSLTSFAFSTDNTYLVTGSDDCTIRVWNLKTTESVTGMLSGHGGSVTSVALSSDYTRVVSCSIGDKTIRVWSTRKPIIRPAPPLKPSLSSSAGSSPVSILEDWMIEDDGWVTNSSSAIIFWVPSDFVSSHVWPSPHAEFIITKE